MAEGVGRVPAVRALFRLLKEPAQPLSSPALIGLSYLFWLLVCVGVGALVNAVKGRPVMNGAQVGFVLIVFFIVIRMALVLLIGLRSTDGAEKLGEQFGAAFGEGLIPLALALFLARRFKAKAAPHPA